MDDEEQVWLHAKMPTELQEKLDEMVLEDDSDRSKFIRQLIRQEYARRQQLPLPGFEQDSSTRTAGKRTAKTIAA